MTDTYLKLYEVADGLIKKYPSTSDDVFKFLGRLTEEVGELAEQVNYQYGGSDSKGAKLGEPDRAKLADEVRDVIVGALAIARFTGTESDVLEAIERRRARLLAQGLITERMTDQ